LNINREVYQKAVRLPRPSFGHVSSLEITHGKQPKLLAWQDIILWV
jgi:hypothetical protein